MIAANAAGVRVFATGGIGGVHRGGEPQVLRHLGRPRGARPHPGRGRLLRPQVDPGRAPDAGVPRDARRARSWARAPTSCPVLRRRRRQRDPRRRPRPPTVASACRGAVVRCAGRRSASSAGDRRSASPVAGGGRPPAGLRRVAATVGRRVAIGTTRRWPARTAPRLAAGCSPASPRSRGGASMPRPIIALIVRQRPGRQPLPGPWSPGEAADAGARPRSPRADAPSPPRHRGRGRPARLRGQAGAGHGARRHRPGGRAGRVLRPARAQRRGQDHADQDPHHAAPADDRHGRASSASTWRPTQADPADHEHGGRRRAVGLRRS